MKKLFLCVGLLMVGLAFIACSDSSHSPKTTTADTEPVVLIPNQEGLEEGLEFRFLGEYDTHAIGIATVTGNFYNDGTYEVYASIASYTAYITVGEWNFADNVFTLTDEDTSDVITTHKDGETYSFVVYLNGTDIVMSATMIGTKEYVRVEKKPDENPVDEPETPKAILSTVDLSDHVLQIDLFDDNSVSISNTAEPSVTSVGTWSYSAESGLQITVEDSAYAITFDGENYLFQGSIMGLEREFSNPKQALDDAVAGKVAIIFPTVSLPGRYEGVTEEQWDQIWAENDADVGGTVVPADFPDTSIDDLFKQMLPKEYLTPVAAEDRGVLVKLDYETYLCQLNEDYEIPQPEWTPISKTCFVYLPAGYSREKQYNVYYLMHGAGGDETDWFSMNIDGAAANGEGDFVMPLDYLIANGLVVHHSFCNFPVALKS